MSTKIIAASLATSAGVTTIITRSSNPGNILSIVRHLNFRKVSNSRPLQGTPSTLVKTNQNGETSLEEPSKISEVLAASPIKPPLHTRFIPYESPIRDRHFWLLHGLAPHGTIYIDNVAQLALTNNSGLLPVGVVDVEGNFAQQEAVRLVVVNRLPTAPHNSADGKLWDGPPVEIGRALVNYSATEIARIKGVKSTEITELLGYADSDYVALGENIGLSKRESRPETPSLEV